MQRNVKEDIISDLFRKEFKEKVIKIIISKIEEYKKIPKRIDWHFLYNIPNYLTHKPLRDIPIIQRDEKEEKIQMESMNACRLVNLFTVYMNALLENYRFEKVF